MDNLLAYLDAETDTLRRMAAREAVCRPDLAAYLTGYSDAYEWAADNIRQGADPHDVAAVAAAGPSITASTADALRGAQDGYAMVAYELVAAERHPEPVSAWMRATTIEAPRAVGTHDRKMAAILAL